MHKNFTIFFLFLFSLTAAYAQMGSRYVKIKEVSIDPDNPSQARIQYNLVSESEEDRYTIRLFLSTPGGDRELFKFDKGSSIGENIPPGMNKTIFWKASDEFTDFSQNVVFIIHAELTFTPISVIFPSGGEKFKRKQFMSIKWKGGVEKLPVTINLHEKGGDAIEIVSGIKNLGEHEWKVDKKLKGKYYLNISQGEKQVASGQFKVKRRFSMFNRFLIGAAVITAGSYVYLNSLIPEELEGPPRPGQ